MQSLEHSSDRFPMPRDPPDAPESTSNRYLKNTNFEDFQNFEAPGGAMGSAPDACMGGRLGPATEYEYDMMVKCHCTVDAMVRYGCYASHTVLSTPRKHCIELYQCHGVLYTKR